MLDTISNQDLDEDDKKANLYLATIREASNLVPIVVTSATPVCPSDYFSRVTKIEHHVEPTREILSSPTTLFDGKPDPQWEAQTILDFKRLQLALSAWTIRRERALKRRMDVIDAKSKDLKPNNCVMSDSLPAPLFAPPRIAGIEEWRSYCYAESQSQSLSFLEAGDSKEEVSCIATTQTWSAPGDEDEVDFEENDYEEVYEGEENDEEEEHDDGNDGVSNAFDEHYDSDLDVQSPTKKLKVTEDMSSTSTSQHNVKYTHPNPPFLSTLLMYDHLMITRLLSRSIKHAKKLFKAATDAVTNDKDLSDDDVQLDTFDHESEVPSLYMGEIPLRSHSIAMRCTLFAASTRGAISQRVETLHKDRLFRKTSTGYFSGILTPSECLWMYALLAKLEQPLQGSVIASVRMLHVLACEMRRVTALGLEQLGKRKENTDALKNQLAALNTLLCVTGKVYSQAWGNDG
jgi:hypothetical protein